MNSSCPPSPAGDLPLGALSPWAPGTEGRYLDSSLSSISFLKLRSWTVAFSSWILIAKSPLSLISVMVNCLKLSTSSSKEPTLCIPATSSDTSPLLCTPPSTPPPPSMDPTSCIT
eukprot:CAMPEP_0172037822 /NCGR_PEP_ID=MMETSP1041-20130122/22967_1 /TAXON_ID=464988 /ORGANISM="Hemiselmis andersenii, Strain CCMP439" /LENGTH=114 /DNA_ID=CAMNT_0012695273 /DNA_START=193 /DNA_END=533 /DNA_ORIENTATION=-